MKIIIISALIILHLFVLTGCYQDEPEVRVINQNKLYNIAINMPENNSNEDVYLVNNKNMEDERMIRNRADAENGKFELYFPHINNGQIVKEIVHINVRTGEFGRTVGAVLEELIRGSNNENLRSPIRRGASVLGVNVIGEVAIVNFSSNFKFATDGTWEVDRKAIVNTVTSIDGIEKIRILVNGYEILDPNGNIMGEMNE